MEQAIRSRAHLERILLVCGLPNAGKSRVIRYMFGDARLGGGVPPVGPLPRRGLSRERCLAGRATSPHEIGETSVEFHKKNDDACVNAWIHFWRISYVSADVPLFCIHSKEEFSFFMALG